MDQSLFRYVWQNSRRTQLGILAIIMVSLPFYWVSLDIPKAIVNDAIQGRAFRHGQTEARLFHGVIALPDFLGGRTIFEIPGIPLEQMAYLFALSGLYLVFVLINGAFKYTINVRKGILGEDMLRRMRFELFALLLRFRPEDIRNVKPAEAASMIKDEVEPIGAFIGDAFIQPVFLGTQALTALIFILMQNFWLGFVALAIVVVQAVVIPYLRREQIRLGRMRQLASRRLAGRIGEVVDGAEAVHVHGTAAFSEADIAQQLSGLYKIRVKLFRRKFSVKYLNNLLAQLTPFFFYAIGGYFALRKSLDIGQLVAVIAAYRDLPPPIKELIDWDQQRNDVTVKYEQIVTQFLPANLLPERRDQETVAVPAANVPIAIEGLRVVGGRGNVQLERMNLTIERPAHVALVGSTGSGRDVLARVLARQITEYQGAVRFGETPLSRISDSVAAHFIAYAGPQPFFFPGTIRANIAYSLLHRVPGDAMCGAWAPREWLDYAEAGVENLEELDRAILEALEVGNAADQIYRFGLLGKLSAEIGEDVPDRLVEARHVVRERLDKRGYAGLVEQFDPQAYNSNATIGRNLMFGVALGDKLQLPNLAQDPYTREILVAQELSEPLTDLGLRFAQTTLETFADLPRDHPLRARYSVIAETDTDEFQRILDIAGPPGGRRKLDEAALTRLINLALSYVERLHRMELVDPALEQRLVQARKVFRERLPAAYASEVEFYQPDKCLAAAPVIDNLLFGRVDYGIGNAEQKVSVVVRETLKDLDLLLPVYRLGLEYDVGIGGSQLFQSMRSAVDIARCLIKKPDILVIHGALGSGSEARAVLDNIRRAMAGRTLLVTLSEDASTEGYDRVVRFEDQHLADDRKFGPRGARTRSDKKTEATNWRGSCEG